MSDINKKAAEILVECGYADYKTAGGHYVCCRSPEIGGTMEAVQVFADTLEGRRQSDAIEDWLIREHYSLWFNSKQMENNQTPVLPRRQWRLSRIKWCLQELIK